MAYSGDDFDEYAYRRRPAVSTPEVVRKTLSESAAAGTKAEKPKQTVKAFSYSAPRYTSSRGASNVTRVPQFRVDPFVYPSGEDVFEDPSYQFRLQEGLKALERSAAAKGTLRSGNTLTDLMKYGQDYASQEYANAANRAAQQYGLNFGASQAMYAPEFAQWQLQNQLRSEAEQRAFQEYQFRLDDEFRRQQMLYGGGLGTF